MAVNEGIFKAYDIRGVYPAELDEDTAYRIGRAFVSFLKCREVIVGQDMRKSSSSLFKALAEGITDQGADVIDIGYASTPFFYFGTAKHKAGMMVTASHNPAKYNGFKMCRDGTVPIGGDSGMQEIKELAVRGVFAEPEAKGSVTKKDIMGDFIAHNLNFLDKGLNRHLKIVVDTGNGMGGYTFPKVFEKIPDVEVIPLFFDVDMSFPNHEANPLKEENIADLKGMVIKENADFGVGIDGDCDRCMFVDENGELITADIMTAILAKVLLKGSPGAKILYDLRSSWATKEIIGESGGVPVMCRVGHAFIKKQMREEDALFAGELSGHLYFRDSFVTESSIISTVLVINLLRAEGKRLSEIAGPLKRYFASGEINSEVEDKEGKMKELEDMFREEAKVTSHLDGIKLEFDDWWFNVRPSNTEPLLRLNLEAKTKKRMEEMRDRVLAVIRS
ncbi:phosphomannomutase/phosphoglucomutase [Candidatus Woesearchaeota archaeon]|nr:phosphomannomutase/phosphoglucomutase [Candidatus Woesearchaeota archaeon]